MDFPSSTNVNVKQTWEESEKKKVEWRVEECEWLKHLLDERRTKSKHHGNVKVVGAQRRESLCIRSKSNWQCKASAKSPDTMPSNATVAVFTFRFDAKIFIWFEGWRNVPHVHLKRNKSERNQINLVYLIKKKTVKLSRRNRLVGPFRLHPKVNVHKNKKKCCIRKAFCKSLKMIALSFKWVGFRVGKRKESDRERKEKLLISVHELDLFACTFIHPFVCSRPFCPFLFFVYFCFRKLATNDTIRPLPKSRFDLAGCEKRLSAVRPNNRAQSGGDW